MTQSQKKILTLAIVGLVLGTGTVFQTFYDRHARTRKELIRKIFVELRGYEPSLGSVNTIFFNCRKLKTLEEVAEESRLIISKKKGK